VTESAVGKAIAKKTSSAQAPELQRVVELLGGRRVFGRFVRSQIEAHDLCLHGLPGTALNHLVETSATLKNNASFEKAVGMSLRTYQRRKGAPPRPLNQEQSGRTWKFAEILSKATAVLGARQEAEDWLERPALGLGGRRPIDLLATRPGVEMLEDHLTRLEYGVYT
jgi:putative toxin-antitoxin system antitoxin component (TIGR02293 family)